MSLPPTLLDWLGWGKDLRSSDLNRLVGKRLTKAGNQEQYRNVNVRGTDRLQILNMLRFNQCEPSHHTCPV